MKIWFRNKSILLLAILISAILLYFAVVYHRNQKYEIVYTSSDVSSHGEIWVYDDHGKRCMSFMHPTLAGSKQTCIYLKTVNTPALEYHKMILGALLLNPSPKKILMLGLGGGAIVRYIQSVLSSYESFDVVEISPDIKKISEDLFFLKGNTKVNIIVQDATQYIAAAILNKNLYDLVIVDVFDRDSSSSELLSQRFLKSIQDIMTKNGVVVFHCTDQRNLNASVMHNITSVFLEFYASTVDSYTVIASTKSPLPNAEQLRKNAQFLAPQLGAIHTDPENILHNFHKR